MAADRNQGWALDSFERYKEFRYCMLVNLIGFVYSGTQALDLSYNLASEKYIVHNSNSGIILISSLIRDARKSMNRPSARKVLDNLIYNYSPMYCGKAGKGYDEVYIFA